MPTTPSTDIEVAQKAMVLIGLEPLTSFTDNTDEALVANTIYEDVVTDCLGQHNWNFATGQKTLSRLSDVPVDRWDAAYALPTNPEVMQVITVTIEDAPQRYDIYERYVYMNAQIDDAVVLSELRDDDFSKDYHVRMLNTKFKSLFSRAVVILNSSGIVIYREQVKEIGDEPNYNAALKIIRDN